MNLRKFISGVSALTIAASAFAGMAVTASAYTSTASSVGGNDKYVENFEGTTQPFDVSKVSANRYVWAVDDADNNGDGTKVFGSYYGHPMGWKLDNARTTDTKIELDFKMDPGYSKNSVTSTNSVVFDGSNFNVDTWGITSTNNILNLSVQNGGNAYLGSFSVNGTNVDATTLGLIKKSGSYRSSQSKSQDRDSTGWLHLSAILDFDTNGNKLSYSITRNGSEICSDSNVTFTPDSFTGIYTLSGGNGGGGTYLDNIVIEDVPVAQSITILGADAVAAGSSETYTAYVLDQYADKFADATLTASGYTSATYSNGTISVPANMENAETITLTASYTGLADATKTVTASTLKGYVINTTPYAAISVDGGSAVSTGREGKYTFAVGTTGEHAVAISKNGYQTVSTTVTAVDNGTASLSLTPNSGIEYKEDFDYVDDSFGFSSGVSVNGGVLTADTDITTSATLKETISVSGKDIRIRTYNNVNTGTAANTNAYIKLCGNLSLYVFGRQMRLMGNTKSQTDFVNTTNYTTLDIVVNGDGTKADYYADGKYIQSVNCTGASSLSSIEFTYVKNKATVYIDELSVVDAPTTYTVTGGEVAGKYISGTDIVLGTSTTGKWTDGTNTYASGSMYTVSGNVTFTEYTTPTDISAPEAVAFTPADDGVTAAAYKFTVTPGTIAVTRITVTPDADHTLSKTVNLISGDVIFGVLFATSTEGVTLPTLTSDMITVE